jgi:MerR family transcriptional regulator, light-induced transcriptional regulator
MEAETALPSGRYPIRVVARLTGIPIDTLRAWERRYRAVEPSRDDRGRLYDDGDLERLKLLKRLVERGHAIGRIAGLPAADLARLLEAGLEPRDRGGRNDEVDLAALLDALDRYDPDDLERRLGRLAAVLSSRELVHDVALPFMRQVGLGWQAGRFRVAQEHLASSALRNLLGALVRAHAPRDGRGRVVLATPPGERHELGITAAAMLAAAGGMPVTYLGADLPPADVAEAARRTEAAAVVMAITRTDATGPALEAVGTVAGALPRGVALFVGGAGADERREEVRRAGAMHLPTFEALERAYRGLGARY